MPVTWLEHLGHRILYVDYRGLHDQAALEVLHEQRAALESETAPVPVLVDVRGAVLGSDFMRLAKVTAPRNTPLTSRRAIVGAEGVKEVLLMGFNAQAAPVPMHRFATVEEALEYLTR